MDWQNSINNAVSQKECRVDFICIMELMWYLVQKKTRAAVLARPVPSGLPQPACPERAVAETHVISIYAPMSHVYDRIGQRDD